MTFTRIFLYLLLLLMPLGNLTRLPFGTVAVTINDFLLPVLIVSWIILVMLGRKEIKLPPMSRWLILFVFWAFITLVAGLRYIGLTELLVSSLYLVRWIEYSFVFIIVYNEVSLEKVADGFSNLSSKLLQILLWGQFAFVLLGFVQYLLFPNFSSFVVHGWDPHFYRLLSTFLDPNFAGLFIILGAVLAISLLLFIKMPVTSRFMLAAFVLLAAGAIIITFSRSTYLAFVIAVGLLGILRSRRMLLIFGLIAVLSFIFIPRVQTRVIGAVELDVTAKARLDDYEDAYEIIAENPILGVGFNTYRYAQDRAGYFQDERGVNTSGGHSGAGVDSSILFILATTGIVGLFIYMAMHIGFVWDAWRAYINRKKSAHIRALGFAVFVSAAALFAHTQFVNSLFYPWMMLWVWTLLGIFYGEKKRVNQ